MRQVEQTSLNRFSNQPPTVLNDPFWGKVETLEDLTLQSSEVYEDATPDEKIADLTLADCLVLDGSNMPVPKTNETPVHIYSLNGAFSCSVNEIPNFIQIENQPLHYRIKGREISRRVPLCRGGRK